MKVLEFWGITMFFYMSATVSRGLYHKKRLKTNKLFFDNRNINMIE